MKPISAKWSRLPLVRCSLFLYLCFSSLSVDAAELVEADPALWKIEGAAADIWLFGSFHLLPPGTTWQTKDVDNAFRSSKILVLEAPIGSSGDAHSINLVRKFGIYGPNEKLSGQLNGTEFARVESLAMTFGLATPLVERMRPWMASMVLTQHFAQAAGYSSETGVEKTLLKSARNSGKELGFFETQEQQLRFFADQSLDVQRQLLRSTLNQIENTPEQFDTYLKAWLQGNEALMGELFHTGMMKMPGFYEVLVRNRNEAWVVQIEDMLDSRQSHFIAVGAGHLVGSDSVIALLRESGHSVIAQ